MAAKPPKKSKPVVEAPHPPCPSSPAQEISIPNDEGGDPLNGINIVPDGDVVLDVAFDTSKETLIATRKANAAKLRGRPSQTALPPGSLKPNFRLLYRIRLSVLKQQSNYFTSLLGDHRFAEAKSIEDAFEKLSIQNVKPSEADIKELPRVNITIDDEETQLAGQEVVFGDLLRMLHGQIIVMDPVTMPYLSTLAVLADRFGCAEPVAKSLHGQLKFKAFKWPATQVRPSREEDDVALSRVAEDTLRQKIYVSWLLDLPLRFQKATGDLIMYGSRQWRDFEEEETDNNNTAWWYLPDDLESELKHRRTCILNTIASIPQHFINLYTISRTRQCKLGYDSSASCDSYQLGETIKFLLKRNLLTLTYFTSSTFTSATKDYATVEIYHILTILKQFPSYQIDKNHTNCGPRTRLKPILDFISALLSSKLVSISRADWLRRREDISWKSSRSSSPPPLIFDPMSLSASLLRASQGQNQPQLQDDYSKINGGRDQTTVVFRFTRSMASDQRLRFPGSLGADQLVTAVFTADEWDWTPDQD